MTMRKTREIRLNCPYGYWRLEDGQGSVLTIPNGIIGEERLEGGVAFFQGRVILNVPEHWREPVNNTPAEEQKR